MERLYGAEIEKTVSSQERGSMHRVSQKFFKELGREAWRRGRSPRYHRSDIDPLTIIGVRTKDLGEQGLDNGFNLLETSFPPQESLFRLAQLMELDLDTVQRALELEGATVINLAIHPLGKRDIETYNAFVAPKGIYEYLWFRGWDHSAGIDARAQNSPTTSVSAHEAADALSVVLGCSPAFIGIFGNSPFEEGKRSEYKEARLKMWERMMRNSKVHGDHVTAEFPPFRFKTLAQYFHWMFGEGTGIHFVIAESTSGDYKGIGDKILIVEGNPSVLTYLSQPCWKAYFLKDVLKGDTSNPVLIKPEISHMETMQFAQFSGARIRYVLDKRNFPLKDFLNAVSQPDKRHVEEIFSLYAKSMWIEGRDPGANFPDEELWEAGDNIARSVVIAPSALQAGLIRNLEESVRFIDRYNWEHLKELREAAIKYGLDGEVDGVTVYDFAKKVLEIAAKGLTREEQEFLEYPLWVIQTGKNGADRAIEFVEKEMESGKSGSLEEAIEKLVKHRRVIVK